MSNWCLNCKEAILERCHDYWQCPKCDSTFLDQHLIHYNNENISNNLNESIIEKNEFKSKKDFEDWLKNNGN